MRGKHRKTAVEKRRIDLRDRVHGDDRDIEPAAARGVAQNARAADNHKGCQPKRATLEPGLGDQFWADSRRIAQREGERRDLTRVARPAHPPRSIVNDIGVVAQVAQIALRTLVDAFVFDLAHQLVEIWTRFRFRVVATA